VVPYFARAARHPLAVVDYDRLMLDAKGELMRVARELSLPVTPQVEAGVDRYAGEFLSKDLRHHSFGEDDLRRHPRLNPLARDAYLALHRLASGEATLECDAFKAEWARIERAHADLAPVLRHIDSLEAELRRQRKGVVGALVVARDYLRKRRGDGAGTAG
jgi:hypothetical protein